MNRELLFPAFTVRRKPPVNIDDADSDLSFLRPEEACAPCYLYTLRNAYVSPVGMVFKNWKVLEESLSFKGRRWEGTFYKKILLGRDRRVPGTCVVMHNQYYRNYYHWTLEALPRLFCIRDRIRDASLLLPEEIQPFHMETLRFFDFKRTEFIKATELARAEKLLLPAHTAPFAVHNEKLVVEMGRWMRERVPGETKDFEGWENVYVTRGGSRHRRLINEDEVVDLLHRYDFRTVNPEDFSIPEQIRLFGRIRNLVAIYGSGLTNVVYMQPGGSVLTLINEYHRDCTIYNLACALGQEVGLLQCKTDGGLDRDTKKYDMVADIAKLRRYVEQCIRRPPGRRKS